MSQAFQESSGTQQFHWNILKLLERSSTKQQTQKTNLTNHYCVAVLYEFPSLSVASRQNKGNQQKNIQDINPLEQGSAISQKSCRTIFSKHQSSNSANKWARNCRLFSPR